MNINLSSFNKEDDEEENNHILSIKEDINVNNIEQMQMINNEENKISKLSPE